MSTEVTAAFAPLVISVRGVSFLADNICPRYAEAAGEVKRGIGVLKMCGSRHDLHLREPIIETPRIHIGAQLTEAGMSGESLCREAIEVHPGQPELARRTR